LNIRLVRLGGACGVVGPVVALVMVFAATAISPWFRWDTNALSDLGVRREALIFNTAVIIGGVFTLPFALGLREYLPKRLAHNFGIATLLAGGISLALVGVFTEAYGILHSVVSIGFFVLVPIGLLVLGAGAREMRLGRSATVTGVAALLAIFGLPFALPAAGLRVGFAVPEIVEAIILSAWIIGAASKLLLYKQPSYVAA